MMIHFPGAKEKTIWSTKIYSFVFLIGIFLGGVQKLGGGFKDFLFSSLLGEDSHFD